MLRLLTIAAFLAAAGCSEQALFMTPGKSSAIPGTAIEAYAKEKALSPQEARQAMIADNLTSRGASLPKQALQPLASGDSR
jgi:hypothetical protein